MSQRPSRTEKNAAFFWPTMASRPKRRAFAFNEIVQPRKKVGRPTPTREAIVVPYTSLYGMMVGSLICTKGSKISPGSLVILPKPPIFTRKKALCIPLFLWTIFFSFFHCHEGPKKVTEGHKNSFDKHGTCWQNHMAIILVTKKNKSI